MTTEPKSVGGELPEAVAWLAEYGGDIYTANQLHQAIAAAVLPLKAEIERLTTRLKITGDTMNGYMLERDTLQSKVTQLQQELAAALVCKQDAERWRFVIDNLEEDYTLCTDAYGLGYMLSDDTSNWNKTVDAARAQEVKTPDASKDGAV